MKNLVFFGLILGISSAYAWEYRIVENGEIVYAEGIPPVDLTYPAPGEPTPITPAGETIQGRLISSQELNANLEKQHIIIIPDEKELNSPRPTYQISP